MEKQHGQRLTPRLLPGRVPAKIGKDHEVPGIQISFFDTSGHHDHSLDAFNQLALLFLYRIYSTDPDICHVVEIQVVRITRQHHRTVLQFLHSISFSTQ